MFAQDSAAGYQPCRVPCLPGPAKRRRQGISIPTNSGRCPEVILQGAREYETDLDPPNVADRAAPARSFFGRSLCRFASTACLASHTLT